jgi:hypothetical protein
VGGVGQKHQPVRAGVGVGVLSLFGAAHGSSLNHPKPEVKGFQSFFRKNPELI